MFQFDINLEFSIFNSLYHECLAKVKENLTEKAKRLAWVNQRENLTADQLKRAQAEEEHIRLMGEFIDLTDTLFNIMNEEMNNKKELQILWHEEWRKEVQENQVFVEMMIKKYQKLKK